MGEWLIFRDLHEENSSEIPAQWSYQSIKGTFKLLLTNQSVLNNSKPVEVEFKGI